MNTRKQSPKQAAYLFFLRNAGFGYDPQTETRQQGKSRCARQLAKAERDVSAFGYTFEWVSDDDADRSWFAPDMPEPEEAFGCIARSPQGSVVASLWGIFDPSHEYRRVIEAELAQEALGA